MTEIDETEARQPKQLKKPRRLELKKTVEKGQVRQSFSHGRSKMVTVEVRKKRTFASDGRGRMSEVQRDAQQEGARSPADRSRESVSPALTTREKATRARVLEEARRAEEARPSPEELEAEIIESEVTAEAPVIIEPSGESDAAVEAEAATAAPSAEEADHQAPPAAAEQAEPAPEEDREAAAPAADAEPEAAAAEAAAPAEAEKSQPATTSAAKPAAQETVKKAVPPAKGKAELADQDESSGRGKQKKPGRADGRRPDDAKRPAEEASGRRSGRISITDALDEGSERMRSLASVRRARQKERMKQLQSSGSEAVKVVRDVVIPEVITVQELANRMAERGAAVIKSLMKMGVMATINHTIDGDTAELIANEFGHNVKRVSDADVEAGLGGDSDDDRDLEARPPVVTIMGHVDHGKTSLLDALRKTDVAAHEAGGITQHIGAYQVTLESGDKITFIDTPGHAAFTNMRARGARATDVVVLVVAADDGVMPQTIEAIAHAKAADVPIIVAINKIDRPDANPQKIQTDLMQHGVFVEDMGGETLCVAVSAKTGQNLDKLAETILLQAEILDLKANPGRPAEGIIIESKMERGRGTVATVLVQRGTLQVGDVFVAGSEWGRVRGLMDASGATVEQAGPSVPVEVLGLNGPPAAGDDVVVVENESRAREVSEFRQRRSRDARTTTSRGTLEQMMNRIQEGETQELAVLIKADVHGSVEAIVNTLEKIGSDQIKVNVLHHGVGGINETDVGLARASNALVIGFNVRANPQAREMAKRDGVEIRYYSIIYNLTDDIKSVMTGMLSPTLQEKFIGYADIRQVFNISKVGKVAGCMVTEGVVRRNAKVRLLRDNVVIHEGDLGQLKRFKEDAREVREGYDCGISLSNYQDIQVGDTIECFEMEEVAQQL